MSNRGEHHEQGGDGDRTDTAMVTSRSLYDYFQAEVAQVATDLRSRAPADAQVYVADLLARFGSSDRLFVVMEGRRETEPLALILKRAMEADEAGRVQELRRLGDVALYTTGLFPERLQRRGMELDYFIRMGGTAYSSVADLSGRRSRGPMLRELYQNLAAHFRDLVDLLAELAERTHLATERGILSMVDAWHAKGDARAGQKLTELGVILAPGGRACVS